jgi:hypothetical protein
VGVSTDETMPAIFTTSLALLLVTFTKSPELFILTKSPSANEP